MKSNYLAIFFLGKPGSGKDTQAYLLAKKLKLKVITSSDLIKQFFRKSKKRKVKIDNFTVDLEREKEKFYSGKLVGIRFVTWLICQQIISNARAKKGFIGVGAFRSLTEAKQELILLEKYYPKRFLIIFLEVGLNELKKRVKIRQRKEGLDQPKIFEKRIKEFKKYTKPAVDYLKQKGVLEKINGQGSILQVHSRVMKVVKKRFGEFM